MTPLRGFEGCYPHGLNLRAGVPTVDLSAGLQGLFPPP